MKVVKLMAIMVVSILGACNNTPEPVSYGKDACTHCKMTIMDKRFAAEIITARGKIFKFDAVECMVGFLKEKPEIAKNENSTFLVSDFSHPGEFVDARQGFFLKDKLVSSPMGSNLAAFLSKKSAETLVKDSAAKIYTWALLLKSK
ncbi:MAG: nitrous oxide reductase accessory protein NosL [Mucilaginibacter sp.]